MPSVGSLNLEHLAIGLVAGALVLAAARPARTRATYPLLATMAVVLLTPRLEVTLSVGGAVVLAALTVGWGARDLASAAPAAVLGVGFLVGLVGAWAAVPDTEGVLVGIGVAVTALVVAAARRPTVVGFVGWPLLALGVAVVVGGSSDERLVVAIGGLGCLAAVPAIAIAGRVEPVVRSAVDVSWRPRPAAATIAVPLGAAWTCARVATDATNALRSAAIVLATWAFAVLVLVAVGRALRRRPRAI